jgi:shikimate kinase
VLDASNRERMRERGTVIWLRVPPELLVERVRAGLHRPLLDDDPAATLARLATEREQLYRVTAHEIIDVGASSPDEIVDTIAIRVEAAV